MKYIPLSKGIVGVVCNCHFDLVKEYKWFYKDGYAVRNAPSYRRYGKRIRRTIWMHRVINNTPEDLFADHINGDKTDNRCSNLRAVTKSQNNWNRKKQIGASKHKGVSKQVGQNGWKAQLQVNGEKIYLGYFKTEDAAAKAYRAAVKKYHGEYARIK